MIGIKNYKEKKVQIILIGVLLFVGLCANFYLLIKVFENALG